MRKRRELLEGAEYHVTAKINRNEFVFQPDEIKELFLFIVARAKKRYKFNIRNFVVMSNHIHLMIRPGKDENLSRIMQWILSVFAVSYNKSNNITGHLWYDRFKSKIITSYRQLLATFKYICNNPVKAGITESPEIYDYGGLWFIKNRKYEIIDPPDLFLYSFIPDLFISI